MIGINILPNSILINGLNEQPRTIKPNEPQETQETFAGILGEKIYQSTKLQFSKHANMRLSARNINFSDEQIERIENGVQKAQQKGIRDSLVVVDNVSLVVNVGTKIVITAVNNGADSVFTNIDGAVIV
ncbi:flagellar protein [Clostridia bacterium]|nr:flagellar protein [Clostridia bacterium]